MYHCNTNQEKSKIPLHIAIESGNGNEVLKLLKCGVDPDIKNRHGAASLRICINRKRSSHVPNAQATYSQIACTLITYGATVDESLRNSCSEQFFETLQKLNADRLQTIAKLRMRINQAQGPDIIRLIFESYLNI